MLIREGRGEKKNETRKRGEKREEEMKEKMEKKGKNGEVYTPANCAEILYILLLFRARTLSSKFGPQVYKGKVPVKG